MKKIVIIGAGGFGRETAWLIRQINVEQPSWNLVGFYDDGSKTKVVDGLPVLGTIADLNLIKEPLAVVISVADPSVRKAIYHKITSPLVEYPSLFHPLCQKGDANNSFGKGCIITSGCIFTINIKVEDFVIVNLATTVGHDVMIGEFTAIMPNCSISGAATIGKGCMIGAGVRILPRITIGDNSVAGAGAVVTKDAIPGSRLVGVPAINTAPNV